MSSVVQSSSELRMNAFVTYSLLQKSPLPWFTNSHLGDEEAKIILHTNTNTCTCTQIHAHTHALNVVNMFPINIMETITPVISGRSIWVPGGYLESRS